MPIPILGAAAAAAGGSIIGSTVGGFTSSAIDPYSYDLRLFAFQNNQVLLPDPSSMIAAYHKGRLTRNEANNWLGKLGINSGLAPGNFWRQRIWSRVIDSMRDPVPFQNALNRYHREAGLQGVARAEIMRHGYGQTPYLDWVINPNNPLPLGMLMQAYNAGHINPAWWIGSLQAQGFTEPRDIAAIDRLRYLIPPPSDLILFAVREVWDNTVVNRFEYDADFPQSFQFWMDKQGMGWKPSDLYPNIPGNQDIPWPLAHWRAHWRVMSPSEAMVALYRLRPRTPTSNVSRIEGIPAFREDDFDYLLKVADYPPIIRKWLKGLAYRPLTRIDIRRAYEIDTLSPQQVIDHLQDIGYSEDNARILERFYSEQKERKKLAAGRTRLRTAILKAMRTGTIDRNRAARELYRVSLPTVARIREFDERFTTEQNEIANADPDVRFLLTSVFADDVIRRAGAHLRNLRKAFLQGAITRDNAYSFLVLIGIDTERADNYLEDWTLELQSVRKLPTVAQLLKFYVRGAISAGEVFGRLVNLGYTTRDANIMIRLANDDMQTALLRAQEKAARTEQAQQKALEALINEQRKQLSEAERRLTRSATVANILEFYRRDLITRRTAYLELRKRGVDRPYAILRIQNEDKKRKGETVETNSQEFTEPSGNGQGSQSDPGLPS